METAKPVLRPEGWRRLTPDLKDALLKLKFVAPDGGAERIRCPVCPRAHYESVITRHTRAGVRHFIRCPVEMRVEVDLKAWQTWRINAAEIATTVRGTMNLSGTLRNLEPDRLWSLGRTRWQGRSREVMLACGVGAINVDPVVQRIGAGHAIVFVPHRIPESHVWLGRVPAIVPLSQVTTIESHGLALDRLGIAAMVDEADREAHIVGGLTLTERELNSVIRRHVKAANKDELTDEALLAVYRVCKSLRATEDALRKEGHQIDHSTIARRVKKAEEAEQLRESRDSNSVSRRVASQPRDRGKKMDQFFK